MASRARQPQLRRRLPAGVLVALIVAALASEASGYEPARGDQFFLLSDASVGADGVAVVRLETPAGAPYGHVEGYGGDRKSTRLNSSHVAISYAVFWLKKNRTPAPWDWWERAVS